MLSSGKKPGRDRDRTLTGSSLISSLRSRIAHLEMTNKQLEEKNKQLKKDNKRLQKDNKQLKLQKENKRCHSPNPVALGEDELFSLGLSLVGFDESRQKCSKHTSLRR